MVIRKSGHIKSKLYYLLRPEFPIFLLDRPQPVVFDAGLSCAGKLYVQAIKAVLGDRQPSILFLTHSHWDHCGSVSTLKKAFPDMKVAASAMVAEVVKRPNALALIRKLNEEAAAQMRAVVPGVDSLLVNEPFSPFEVDVELKDQQEFDLGDGTTVLVLATPGHTQDHHSFYLPQEKILIAGEAAGVYYGPNTISPEFVSDYDAYLSSLSDWLVFRLRSIVRDTMPAWWARRKSAIILGDRFAKPYDSRNGYSNFSMRNKAQSSVSLSESKQNSSTATKNSSSRKQRTC